MNSTNLLGCYDISNVDFRERRTEFTRLWFCFILQPTEQLRRALGKNVVMKAIECVKVPMRMARIGSLIAIIRSTIPLCLTGPFSSEYLRLEPVAPQSEVDGKPGRSERRSMMSTFDGPAMGAPSLVLRHTLLTRVGHDHRRPRPPAPPYPFGRLCHGSSARCPTRALASRIPVGHRPWLQHLRSGSLPPCSLPSSLLCRCQTSSRLTSSAYGITPSRCGPTGCPIGRPEDLPGPGAGCTCVHGVSDAAMSGCASP